MTGRAWAAVALTLALFSAGCIRGRSAELAGGSAAESWQETAVASRIALDDGEYARAESVLVAFERRYPETAEATESLYWRALVILDPRNPSFAPARSAELLQRYGEGEGVLTHAAEATVLRALALRADSLAAAAGSGARPRAAASDDEVQKLREELRRTTEELDRIKRRLSQPTTP